MPISPGSYSENDVVRSVLYFENVSLTTDQKGAIAEAKIAAAAVEHGVGVSRPISPMRYDLVFDLGGHLARVQCKWATSTASVVHVHCRTSRRGPNRFVRSDYVAHEVDLIAAYCAELDSCYALPIDRFDGRSSIQLRLTPCRNNQRARVNWASDYALGATLTRSTGPSLSWESVALAARRSGVRAPSAPGFDCRGGRRLLARALPDGIPRPRRR